MSLNLIEYQVLSVPALPLKELLEQFLTCTIINDRRTLNNIKKAFALLLECFPNIGTDTFSSKELMKYQVFLASKNYARTYCNTLVKFIRTVFYWAETVDLVSPLLVYKLRRVKPLKLNQARENEKRINVPAADFENALPYFPAVIADMLSLQRLTAMRTGEICNMRKSEIKKKENGDIEFNPNNHKTKWAGKNKSLLLGDEELELLEIYLKNRKPAEFVFQNSRKTCFSVAEFGRIIRKTLKAENLVKFTSYQVRHLAITEISLRNGQDFAQAVAGHSNSGTTDIYDHSTTEKQRVVIASRKPKK